MGDAGGKWRKVGQGGLGARGGVGLGEWGSGGAGGMDGEFFAGGDEAAAEAAG